MIMSNLYPNASKSINRMLKNCSSCLHLNIILIKSNPVFFFLDRKLIHQKKNWRLFFILPQFTRKQLLMIERNWHWFCCKEWSRWGEKKDIFGILASKFDLVLKKIKICFFFYHKKLTFMFQWDKCEFRI